MFSGISRALSEERGRLVFLWPVGLMAGISWYFLLPGEPPVFFGIGALAVSGIFLVITWRNSLRAVTISVFLVVLGFSAASIRTQMVATPLLQKEIHYRQVEGTIDEIEPVEKKIKLVISHPIIEGLAAADTPLRLRVSFRDSGAAWQVGDRVRMIADLFPLPQAVMPGSYDFARHFYFRRIGGNGFAMRPPEIVATAKPSGIVGFLNNLRHHIGDDMRSKMPGASGTVAAAMTVGETGPIPAADKDNLRNSGLAHMLAIAGLHLGIVAAIIFFSMRLLLALSPTLALNLPIKKIAAFTAMAGAFFYLLLAGCPIPALRAFIMVGVLFLGFMLDRSGISLRTLSLAAGFILLLFPEAMFGASFQMSFAATIAIISLSESVGSYFYRGTPSWRRRVFNHGMGIVFTSLVATLATAPFVLYNFNRLASFGLLSNIIVVPLATFIIMPAMVISLLLMPLGLQGIGYVPLKFGIDIMLKLAAWVTSLPFASLHFPAPSDTGLFISTTGLLLLCIIRAKWRIFGIPLIIAGLFTIVLHHPPDMLIGHDMRQVMARLDDGQYTMLKGSIQSFTAQDWLRAEGQDEAVPLKNSGMKCDREICRYHANGHEIIIVKAAEDERLLESACRENADALAAWRYLTPESCPGPKHIIGRGELETHGAHELWLNEDGIRIARAHEGDGRRAWQLPIEPEGDGKEN